MNDEVFIIIIYFFIITFIYIGPTVVYELLLRFYLYWQNIITKEC